MSSPTSAMEAANPEAGTTAVSAADDGSVWAGAAPGVAMRTGIRSANIPARIITSDRYR